MTQNPYAPPRADSLLERYPNPHVKADRGKVIAAGVALIVVGLLQLGLGAALTGFGVYGQRGLYLVLATGIEGLLSVALGIFTLRNAYGAAVTGVVLNGFGLLLAVFTGNLGAIGVRLVLLIIVGAGALALRKINRRVDSGVSGSPLTTYYHHVVPLLVRVMAADGHLDQRERQKIREVCDAMQISRYEQQRLIEQSARATAFDVRARARSYLAEARQLGLSAPEQQLIVAALAVAGADGVIVEPERELIEQIGEALGLAAEDVAAQLATYEAELRDLDAVGARKLLGLGPAAGDAEIEKAYQRLAAVLEPQAYGHLGAQLGRHVQERAEVLRRARELALQR